MVESDRLQRAAQAARRDLLARRGPTGHWVGELSSSALSTATAVSALALVRRHVPATIGPARHAADDEGKLSELIVGGLSWLADAQNADGGWGDTDRSLSNIATTMLVRAAFQLTCVPADRPNMLERADAYIKSQGGIAGLRRRYGKDKTFAVPILTNCALAGLVPWREVSPLPFELACLPQSLYRFLRLPVVSYAIPALVAIGQARYFHRKPRNPLARLVRGLSIDKSLRVLDELQPASGGFLEATPLTSFVVMSLAGTGQSRHPVARRGVDFLVRSVRADGSWPIDTNLATWVTTLSIQALAAEGTDGLDAVLGDECVDWLLNCQCRDVHPYTGAAPGGWGWSDLSGSVPDADDTAGALLALEWVRQSRAANGATDTELACLDSAAAAGVGWLLDLQNSNGGWPTFCRGWGKLPFDRSGTDLTAHVLRALRVWTGVTAGEAAPLAHGEPALPDWRAGGVSPPVAQGGQAVWEHRLSVAVHRGFEFLARQQQSDGSWHPLWFGNQHHPREANPVYGTARVLLAYRDYGRFACPAGQQGLTWLAKSQNSDGGWGGASLDQRGRSGVEETALAVEALLGAAPAGASQSIVEKGLAWLVKAVEAGQHDESSPIGFYFAKLWYYEALYPLIFTVSALSRALPRPSPFTERRPALRPEPTTAR
ncbi:MAG TPA: prenyltransferase/squalene oxidase repeat-containing protein [Pirellulales bacterium]|nr:prenyltransferase/squalene oxidase repeat-containing protein [Pirellulales bacterium]